MSLSATQSANAAMVDFLAPSKQGWFLKMPQRAMHVPHTFTVRKIRTSCPFFKQSFGQSEPVPAYIGAVVGLVVKYEEGFLTVVIFHLNESFLT